MRLLEMGIYRKCIHSMRTGSSYFSWKFMIPDKFLEIRACDDTSSPTALSATQMKLASRSFTDCATQFKY